jgi:hypothetical protein
MPVPHRDREAAANAAADRRSPARRASDAEDSEDSDDHEDEDSEEEEEEDAEAEDQSPEQTEAAEALSLVQRMVNLEERYEKERRQDKKRIKELERELALKKEAARADEKTALEKEFPSLESLKKFRRIKFKGFYPKKKGPVKPYSLELMMEGGADRTYTKLYNEGKHAQKSEYALVFTVYLWSILYADAISETLINLISDLQYEQHFSKLFNGLYAALELASARLSHIQVKTFPEEFDEAFQQVVQLTINKSKIEDQLTSDDLSALHREYIKSLQDKSITAAAKVALNAKIKLNSDKPSTSGQGAGSKPDKRRPARKRPEERTAPSA